MQNTQLNIKFSKDELELYNCALAIELDIDLNKEMKEWEIVIFDGLSQE